MTPVYVAASPWKSLDPEACNVFVAEKGTKHKTPVSEYLHRTLRDPLRDLIPSDAEYDHVFDQAEFLFGVLFAHWRGDGRGPIGRFAWRRIYSGPAADAAIQTYKDELVRAGLFGGDPAVLDSTTTEYEERVSNSGLSW